MEIVLYDQLIFGTQTLIAEPEVIGSRSISPEVILMLGPTSLPAEQCEHGMLCSIVSEFKNSLVQALRNILFEYYP